MCLLPWTVCCVPLLILLHLLTPSTGSPPRVQCEPSRLPVIGGTVTLTCEFLSKLDVLQVTWQVDKENQLQTIATFSKKYGMKISSSNDKFRSDNVRDANRSSIIISDLRAEDQACYVCIFNAFPHGAYKGRFYLDFPEPSTVQPAPTFPAPLPVKAESQIQERSKSNDVTAAEHPQDVTCSSSSKKIFDIILKPSEIISEHPANDTDGKPIYERKFTYKNLNMKPSCVFRLQKNRNVKKRALPEEGADEVVFANCTVTGKAAEIIWINEGNPVHAMDLETRGHDSVTVTSARGYLQSSLLEEQIECVIIRKGSKKDLYGAGESFSIRIGILLAAVIVVLALCISMWICSLRKFKETHTPRKPRSHESIINTPRKPCLHESIINTLRTPCLDESIINTPRTPCSDESIYRRPKYQDTLHETPDEAISKRASQQPTPGSSLIKRNSPKSREKRNSKTARPLFKKENI